MPLLHGKTHFCTAKLIFARQNSFFHGKTHYCPAKSHFCTAFDFFSLQNAIFTRQFYVYFFTRRFLLGIFLPCKLIHFFTRQNFIFFPGIFFYLPFYFPAFFYSIFYCPAVFFLIKFLNFIQNNDIFTSFYY